MLASLVATLGPWSWLVLGAVLLIGGILMPGIFLIWIGLAAAAVGLLSLGLWETAWWVWEIQLVAFAALSVVFVLAGRAWLKGRGSASDEPLLNDRGQSLVGRTAVLREPIAEGTGRIHLGDTVWVVHGPDCEAGTRVRVTAARGRDLTVERA